MCEINEEINELENVMNRINVFMKNVPEGCLKWQRKREKVYYYHQYKNGNRWCRNYIGKSNIEFAKILAQKQYYSIMQEIVQKRLHALKQFVKNYPSQNIDDIYDNMRPERKTLIEPLERTIKEKVKFWIEKECEKYNGFSENLRYETEQGDIVRSKSEVIIANLLFQHKDKISYKYEYPLEVMENGFMKTIYPDFSIINLHSGKITYWEHAGMMDDIQYVNEFVKKMNVYVSNGLMPGKDVLISYETMSNPLDIRVVKQMISECLIQ